MGASEWRLAKQVQWAAKPGIARVGSQHGRGRNAYTQTLGDSLFMPLRTRT